MEIREDDVTKLQKLALYEAIKCIEESKTKRLETEIYRKEPLSDKRKEDLLTESNALLNVGMDWIKACLGKN